MRTDATKQTRLLNHRVRGVNDLSRRAAMDQGPLRRFRSQLASRARGSRETAERAAVSAWSSEAR